MDSPFFPFFPGVAMILSALLTSSFLFLLFSTILNPSLVKKYSSSAVVACLCSLKTNSSLARAISCSDGPEFLALIY